MKIDIKTGVVDFGNGLVVDPRDTATEFERKMPLELLTKIWDPGESIWYMAKNMYVQGIDMNIDITIDFDSNEKLYKINFYRTLSSEEKEKGYIWYATVYEKEYEKYIDILVRLLNVANSKPGRYKFPWGIVGATLDNRDFYTDIEIRYEEETEYEREYCCF